MSQSDFGARSPGGTGSEGHRSIGASGFSGVASGVGKATRSGALAAGTGALSILRAVGALRRGNRRRAAVRILAGLFWVGIAVAQRRSTRRASERGDGSATSAIDQTDVVDTAPDLDDVASPGDTDRGERTGEGAGEVVDTTAADIDESDTAPRLDSDVEAGDVDQTDVVETGIDDDLDEVADGSDEDRRSDE